MVSFAANRYRPFLERSLRKNLLTLSLFFVALLMTLSIYIGGWIKSGFFPNVTSDWVVARVELKEGIAFQDTLDRLQQVESAATCTKQGYNQREEFAGDGPVIGLINSVGKDNQIDVRMELENKDVNIAEVSDTWREQIGDLGEVEDRLDYTLRDNGKPIRLVLASPSVEQLELGGGVARGVC